MILFSLHNRTFQKTYQRVMGREPGTFTELRDQARTLLKKHSRNREKWV